MRIAQGPGCARRAGTTSEHAERGQPARSGDEEQQGGDEGRRRGDEERRPRSPKPAAPAKAAPQATNARGPQEGAPARQSVAPTRPRAPRPHCTAVGLQRSHAAPTGALADICYPASGPGGKGSGDAERQPNHRIPEWGQKRPVRIFLPRTKA